MWSPCARAPISAIYVLTRIVFDRVMSGVKALIYSSALFFYNNFKIINTGKRFFKRNFTSKKEI